MGKMNGATVMIGSSGTLPAHPRQIRALSPLLLLGEGAVPVAHDLLSHLLMKGERALAGGGRTELLDYLKRHCGHHVEVERLAAVPEPAALDQAVIEDRQLALPL